MGAPRYTRSRAPLSLATVIALSNSATAPSIRRMKGLRDAVRQALFSVGRCIYARVRCRSLLRMTTTKASHRALATVRCNSDGNCRVGLSKADCLLTGGRRHDTRDHLEKAIFTLHRCPRAPAGNCRSLRRCHRGRWGCHGAADGS